VKAIRVASEEIVTGSNHYDILVKIMKERMWDEVDVDAELARGQLEFGQLFIARYEDGDPVYEFTTDQSRNDAYGSLYMVEMCRVPGVKRP
jgi:hypothetical protein